MKILLKVIGIITISIATLISCEKDIYENMINSSASELTFHRISISTLNNDSEFVNVYWRVGKLQVRNDAGMQNKSVLENNYGFTIIDLTVNLVEYGGSKSYSFLIKKDSLVHTKFQNLLVEIESPTSSKFIIIDYQKSIIGDGSNRENYDVVKMEDIAFDPSLTISTQQRLKCISIITIFCSGNGPDEYCGGSDTQYGCSRSEAISCFDDGSGGGGGNSSGTIAVPNPGPAGGNTAGGSGLQTFPNTPCGSLAKKSSELPFQINFKNLNKAENYAKNYEQGYYEKKDSNGKPVTVFVRNQPETSDLPIPDGSYSYIHIHNNNYIKTDEDGNETEIKTIKIPSPADLFALLSKIKMSAIASNIPFQDTYGMMFSSEGIFAIKPLQSNFDTIILNDSQNDFRKEYEKKVTKVLKKDSLSSTQRKEALQKNFLQLLKTYGLDGKVGLFEASSDIEPGQTLPNISWTQKSIGPNGELVETPC